MDPEELAWQTFQTMADANRCEHSTGPELLGEWWWHCAMYNAK